MKLLAALITRPEVQAPGVGVSTEVTLGAIAASAAAITGIAIKAARDDKPDALDRSTARPRGAAGGPAGAVLRF